jgi:hypothetical protein
MAASRMYATVHSPVLDPGSNGALLYPHSTNVPTYAPLVFVSSYREQKLLSSLLSLESGTTFLFEFSRLAFIRYVTCFGLSNLSPFETHYLATQFLCHILGSQIP